VAKINIATAIRQPYERWMGQSIEAACQAVYDATVQVVREDLETAGNAAAVGLPGGGRVEAANPCR